MCGNVICGRVDPAKPFFTPHGSFWTNSTTRLLESTTDADRQTRTRNRCNGEGYESVALLPLSVGGERLGLLQLNDPRENVFSAEIIRLWERLADYLSVALAKFMAEESLRESREDLNRAQAVAHIGSWRLKVRENELFWSDENHRIFGVPKGTPLTYETFLEAVHPEDRQYVDQQWKAAIKGESYDIDHRIIVNDMIKWVRERVELEFDQEGVFLSGFGTTQDITERKLAEQKIFEINQRVMALMQAVPVGVSFSDDAGCQSVTGNPAALSQFEAAPEVNLSATAPDETMYGRRVRFFKNGREISDAELPLQRAVAENTMIPPMELEVILPSGRRWVAEASGAPVRDAHGNVIAGVAVTVDITERKKQEEQLRHLNRTLRALSNANEAIIHAENESDLLNEVCRIIAKTVDHAMVWIGFAQEDEGKIVRPMAQAGFEKGYLERLNITWADTERGQGPTGTAIRTGKVDICRNMTKDPRMHPWRAEAVKRGYSSSIAIPMKAEGRVFGALTIYGRKPDAFSDDEVKLLVELTDDLAYGITAIRIRLAQQQAEDALRQNEARFRLLSNTANRLLASENPQGIVNELCREVMEHLDCHAFFNFMTGEAAGKLHLNACAGIPDEEAARIAWLDYGVAVCGCAAQEGVPIVVENIQTNEDPRTDLVKSYGIQAYACHPLVAQGRIIGTLSFGTRTRPTFTPEDLALMRIVTDQVATAMERMRLIRELQKSKEDLEIKVNERTADLQKTNAALAQSNKVLDEFAYVASHDLQEPLRKIQTFSDRLKTMPQDFISDKAQDYLSRMQSAAGRMRALIQDLLMYSRLTSKPAPFTIFNLKIPAEEAVKDLYVLFEETRGLIEINELPDVEGDQIQIRQLFQNLIENALKYHGEDQPKIKISGGLSASGSFTEIYVQDNGIGFDESHLDKIFKPFQRLHAKGAPYPGTGMGLAICRRIAEHHGGDITAKSKPGEGTTFIVTLPKH